MIGNSPKAAENITNAAVINSKARTSLSTCQQKAMSLLSAELFTFCLKSGNISFKKLKGLILKLP
jgi:hypothetical protein